MPTPSFSFCFQLVAAIVFISFGVVAAFCCAIVDGVFAARHLVGSIFLILLSIAFLGLKDLHTKIKFHVTELSSETFTISLSTCVCLLLSSLLPLFFIFCNTHTHTETDRQTETKSHQLGSNSSTSQVTFLRSFCKLNRRVYILKSTDSRLPSFYSSNPSVLKDYDRIFQLDVIGCEILLHLFCLVVWKPEMQESINSYSHVPQNDISVND